MSRAQSPSWEGCPSKDPAWLLLMAQGIPSGSATGGRAGEKWVVEVGRKKQHTTCQFIQHFREQLLAGRVKNEEFLEPEKCVSEVDTTRVKSRFPPALGGRGSAADTANMPRAWVLSQTLCLPSPRETARTAQSARRAQAELPPTWHRDLAHLSQPQAQTSQGQADCPPGGPEH